MEKASKEARKEARKELSLDVAVKIAQPGTTSAAKIVVDAKIIEEYLLATD